MSPAVAERAGVPVLSGGRTAVFFAVCVLSAVLLEDPLEIAGAAPDFLVIALVYGAIRWGAAAGSALGFALGIFRDTLYLLDFGIHALGMTALGYVIGKLRDTLYLSARAVDLLLLAGTKVVIDVLVLGAAAEGAWTAFEMRFFWEAPLAALYTTVVGAVLYRLLAR
ncbi:MAG: rod shape-determining protein MreD [Gemmatimonadota bacterium]|nr:rod shape-determining protein MreD [Gemmatimonadota bacterium]